MEEVLEILKKKISDFHEKHDLLNACHGVAPAELRKLMQGYTFDEPIPLEGVLHDVFKMMDNYTLHVTSNRYFGLFNPTTTLPAILADAIVSLYNPILPVWTHAPIANEIERHVIQKIASFVYPGINETFGCFTNGGSEANMTGILAAAQRISDYSTIGFRHKDPVIYTSALGHHSLEKITKCVGIGTRAIQRIPVTSDLVIDTALLKDQIAADRIEGREPFLILGTAGTTAFGTIDPCRELAAIAKDEGMWLHVDAAWAGAALLSDVLRKELDGIELADSVTIDAHKWLNQSACAGMFFTRHKTLVNNTFSVSADYMPASGEGIDEPYLTTIQWSRRFNGLKLFMTLAADGLPEVTRRIEKQTQLGALLRNELATNGWRIVNATTALPVVCFTPYETKGKSLSTKEMLSLIYERNNIWISDVTLPNGVKALRACITSYKTDEDGVHFLIRELNRVREILHSR